MRVLVAPFLALAALAAPTAAQIVPQPGLENPRLQTVLWQAGEEIWLTALPATGLTVVLERGEQISSVTLADPSRLDVRISAERDSFLLFPRQPGDLGSVVVATDRRNYRFTLRTGNDLLAAYLVQLAYADTAPQSYDAAPTSPVELAAGPVWPYRLKGDKVVQPLSVRDDGRHTFIEFAQDAPLPAIFAIGATGDEQLVNGYMRGDRFVIDRVWSELVFRIDKKRATARREPQPEGGNG
ncbi:TrbG/VirB9 family P-type conjugative transfer protein [Qipengyuania marisflavi]|uniref:Conjugal transfer protein TrbG n=1 Tax=Qipengyuania marisflavi TaxID=2486356 RepID=A0A5S3PSU9_9SPHN|nr:TrbG/VirB9 family P-type conjugative transfer protein [Qipengyuania marisflavi]TMM46663.1 hypothetical protein FEV51_10520 [Qipengyuania marisflavi]